MFSALPSTSLRWLAGILLLTVLVVGCSGGNPYTVQEGRIAERFLPTERSVGHHPDSLKDLAISEKEGKIHYQLERDYESLIEKWSCTYQSVGTRRSRHHSLTYATLWSLELSLVSLQPELGVLALQKERARGLIAERRKKYFDTIQIDVYWFVDRRGNGVITGPSARTELEVRDSTYRPIREDHGPLREAFINAGGTVLYRRNTLHFPRFVKDGDILKNASEVRLNVRRSSSAVEERFTWEWETESQAVRSGSEGVRMAGMTPRSPHR